MALDLDIWLSQHDHNGADFICRVTGRKFYLGSQPGDYGSMVFYEDDCDNPIMIFGRNYKSKRSTRLTDDAPRTRVFDNSKHSPFMLVG